MMGDLAFSFWGNVVPFIIIIACPAFVAGVWFGDRMGYRQGFRHGQGWRAGRRGD
jgi:hypothetical protein